MVSNPGRTPDVVLADVRAPVLFPLAITVHFERPSEAVRIQDEVPPKNPQYIGCHHSPTGYTLGSGGHSGAIWPPFDLKFQARK